MKIQYSRFRTLLFTFTLGLAVVSIQTTLSGYLEKIPVNVPKVESDTPIIIRLCPEILTSGQIIKGYQEDGGYIYFSKEKAMNCSQAGGGA
jgi:hypothetical protein